MVWLIAALACFIFQIATILILEFRHPAKTVAWLMILFMVPIFGFVMYYFLAKEYTQRREFRRKGRKMLGEFRRELLRRANVVRKTEQLNNKEILFEDRLLALLHNIPGSPVTQANRVDILLNGEETFAAILRAMEAAEHHIHIEYYTVRDDDIGRRFQQCLIRKAGEGVQVRLIYDGVGSYDLPQSYIKELHRAGVETRCFLPLLFAFFDKRMNYRNHRKIVVVDGKIGFTGGLNVADEYLGKNRRYGFWRDTHLMLRGDAVYYLQHTFLADWAFVSGQKITHSQYFPEHHCAGTDHVQIVAGGPDTQIDALLELFFGAINSAKQRILIETPYFIPDPSLVMALKTASVSGVDVRIILPGVSDSKVVQWASLSFVEELIRAGVRFFQYQKGFMHAKVLIVDDMLATVGTANVDMRSLFSNFEINAILFDNHLIRKLRAHYLQDESDSKELILSEFMQRPKTQKAMEIFARLLSPLF